MYIVQWFSIDGDIMRHRGFRTSEEALEYIASHHFNFDTEQPSVYYDNAEY